MRSFDSLLAMDYFERRRQLGQCIAEARKRQNISQTQLALMSDINKGYLSEIENGISNISVNKLFRIADSLGVHPAVLFAGIEPSDKDMGRMIDQRTDVASHRPHPVSANPPMEQRAKAASEMVRSRQKSAPPPE